METQKRPGLRDRVTGAINTAKTYWNEPPKGNYVAYKEIGFLSGAGFGVYWLTLLASAIGLDASNFIVGASIGLKPTDLYVMLVVANLVGIPMGIFRSWYYDNHHLKGGKFLPFIRKTGLPIVLVTTAFVWLPYENMSYITKAVVVWFMYMLMNIFLCFFNESYTYFQQIITPNAQERANVMSISQVIYSLAPTITNLVIPFIAGKTWGLNNIWSYRIIYPVFTLIGLVIAAIFFRKVKERLILPKTKPESVRMLDAIREVAKNKYYWIIQAAAWIVFLESGYGVILGWSFVYGHGGEHQAMLGVANTVIGNAALWSMLLCPFAIKAIGKRNLLITANTINIGILAVLYFVYQDLIAICVLWYLNTFVNTFWNIVQHNISADMRDYHQWKTGVRVDGLFGPLGMIGTVISFFTGMFYPMIYEKMGLLEDYNVLYDDTMRNNLFEVLIICSAVGAFLNLVPFLFYNLTENKHQGYIEVLKIRAMFINHSIGQLDDDELCEVMEIIHRARELNGKERLPLDKSAIKLARKLPKATEEEKDIRYAAIKKAKDDYRTVKETNLFIERIPIILEDLGKFDGRAAQLRLEAARKCVANGELYSYIDADFDIDSAKALPKTTAEEKKIRSDAIKLAKLKKQSYKLIEKYDITTAFLPDESVKTELQEREAANFFESLKIRRELRAYAKAVSVYERATKPYTESELLLTQAKHYTSLQELEERYAAVKASV